MVLLKAAAEALLKRDEPTERTHTAPPLAPQPNPTLTVLMKLSVSVARCVLSKTTPLVP